MYVGVTPLVHTIRGVEQFTYQSPDDASVVLGQVVVIPWRTKLIHGVVTAVTGVPALDRAKTIHARTALILTKNYLAFLRWFSVYYAISLSHTLKYALPPLTRRQFDATQIKSLAIPAGATSLSQLDTKSAQFVKQLDRHQPVHTILLTQEDAVAEIIKTILAHSINWPCAVLVPEEIMLTQLQQQLAEYSPISIHAGVSRPTLRAAWIRMLAGDRALYIGTKRLSLFPLTEVKHIIVVYPEDPAHKQWDLNPRYHVQRLTDQLADSFGTPVTYLSYAPRLEQYVQGNIHLELLTDQALPRQRLITMSGQPLLAAQVVERLEEAELPVVWYQRKGKNRLLVCNACSAVFNQLTIARCTTCGSAELQPRSFGTTSVVEYLKKLIPGRPIIEITADHKNITIPYEQHPIIVATSAVKHVIDWSQVDYVVVALIDHLLGLAHFRAHEYAYQQLVWLRNHARQLDIQTYAPEHPVFQALQQPWPEDWYVATLAQRELFHYPPAADYIMLRHTKTQAQRRLKQLIDLPTDPAWIIDREL